MTQIYQPNIEMFYGTVNDNNSKIIPAPNMGISINYEYANDTIIGYTYSITLNGTITSLDLRNLSYGEEYDPTTYNQRNIGALADSIDKLRFLLAQNGNVLHITDASTGTAFFKAKGGILRGFSVSESNNNWANSATFSATIEFNAVQINDTEDCYTSFLDITGFPTNDKGIVDVNTYKIKDFSDSWSFEFQEENYNVTGKDEYNETYLNLDNSHFRLQYQASATGKTYYVYSDDDTSSATLIPAWEQAKNFVQYRLYNQVTSLINGVLKTYPDQCGSSDGLNDINIPGNTTTGLLSSLGDANYGIYNEEISCDSSESQGTFNANYSCMVRSKRGGSYTAANCLHTIQKSINNNYSNRTTRTISLSGRIEGLMEGGIVRSNKPLELPAQGKLLIYNNMNGQEKFRNAHLLLDKIYNPAFYQSGFGDGKRDLKQEFKNILHINANAFGDMRISPSSDDPYKDSFPHPTSFNLTYDLVEGTIDYSVEYSSLANCSVHYNSITIDIEDPTKVFVVIDIPNSNSCGIIQKLGTVTSKKVSINIEGHDGDYVDLIAGSEIDFVNLLACGGSCLSSAYLPPSFSLPEGIITDQQFTIDPFSGKYSLSLSYICLPSDDVLCY